MPKFCWPFCCSEAEELAEETVDSLSVLFISVKHQVDTLLIINLFRAIVKQSTCDITVCMNNVLDMSFFVKSKSCHKQVVKYLFWVQKWAKVLSQDKTINWKFI